MLVCTIFVLRRQHAVSITRIVLLLMPILSPTAMLGLQDVVDGKPSPAYVKGTQVQALDQGLCWVFSGMGTQWHGMGRSLYLTEPVFKQAVDRCDHALQAYTGWSLVDVLFDDTDLSKIDQTNFAQPAIFAVQVGLAELLRSWGIVPSAVVGHSAGEVGAAYVAGALDFADAIKVIYHRSRFAANHRRHRQNAGGGFNGKSLEALSCRV